MKNCVGKTEAYGEKEKSILHSTFYILYLNNTFFPPFI